MAALLGAPAAGVSQELSVERIFGSAELVPDRLLLTRWKPGGDAVTFVRLRADGTGTDLVAEDLGTGERTILIEGPSLVPPGERRPIDIEGYEWSPDGSSLLLYTRSQRVWRQNTKGVYFLYDMKTTILRPLSTAFGWQQFAKFSPDGRMVGFVRDNNLFVVELRSGRESQLTFDGSEDVINGTFDWVYEEELRLQDGWRWSPDSRRIAFWRLDQSAVRTFHMIDDLERYSRPIPVRYPKAGAINSTASIGVVDLSSGATRWIDTGDNPDVYLARMDWASSAEELVIQRLNRHQNRLDVLLANASTGASDVVLVETSETWVEVDDHLTWVGNGERFLWTSDRDGFDHLYLYDRDGSLARQLTTGPWDIRDVQGTDREARWAYFTASKESPLTTDLYRVPLAGGRVERVSRGDGTHAVDLAPGAAHYIDSYSRAGVPARVDLLDGNGERIRTLVDNAGLASRLEGLDVVRPEVFTFTASDGVELNGWMLKPPDFDESRQYPVLLYVYGGPGSQTVVDSWGGTRYLWHALLAQRGYVVASVDNRGTGARGRDFQKVTYRNLGFHESNDQMEAARHLAALPWVDQGRIGIWGWSYGGYMTLMSMLRGGSLFKAGISVAPVTSWKLYDTIYTERFMRTPKENPDGYRRSAPLSRAAELEGDLLLVHGTGDDNVHFQNTVQMAQALQEAGKQFSLMIYPNRTHSISGGNTQVHLFTLMTNWLQDHL